MHQMNEREQNKENGSRDSSLRKDAFGFKRINVK